MKLEEIYKEELMEMYKSPPNRGKMKSPSAQALKNNPLCGDSVNLQLKVDKGRIVDAKFDGSACAISVISSAFLTELLIGKTIKEAKKISKENLLDEINMNLTTSRVKCATLILDALKDALEIYEK